MSSTHSSDLRVGSRMPPPSVQGTYATTNTSAAGVVAPPARLSTASLHTQRPPAAFLQQRVNVGGKNVPKWALVTTGVLLGAALIYAARRYLRGGRGSPVATQSRQTRSSSSSTATSTARPTKKGSPASDAPTRGRSASPVTATDGNNSLTDTDGEDERVLDLGDDDSLTDAEREFRRMCSHFLTRLGNAVEDSVIDDVMDNGLEQRIRNQLPHALAHFNAASRSLAAHLLLAVNARNLTHSQDEEEFYRLMRLQHHDMQLAWDLLADKAPDSEENAWERRTLDILRIQVAQCLKDGSLMLPVLDRMAANPPASWNVEETMLLFTVAPLVGRWKDTVRFGEHLRDNFPETGIMQWSSMDYQVLLELARERARTHDDAPAGQLLWRQYQITSQRIRLVDISSADASMVAELESQFSDPATGERTWQALETTAASEVVRCGAIVQMKSFSPAGVSLVGPADADHMQVRGRFLLHDGRQHQVETYVLRRVSREEMQGGGVEDAELEDTAAAMAEAEARGIDLSHTQDRDDELARRIASRQHGRDPALQDEFWRGEYVMTQEEHDPNVPDQAEQQVAGRHSHGGVACGHSHARPAAAADNPKSVALASLTVTFELEFVLRPRVSPTDEPEQ